MRVVTVLGAVGVGLGLGSAAVLAPLMMGGASAKVDTAQSLSWTNQWGQQALGAIHALTGTGSKANPVAPKAYSSATTSRTAQVVQPAAAQDTKTIDFLVQQGSGNASTPATVADARIVQLPWKTQVTVAPENGTTPKKLTSSKPSSDEQRQTLVRDLQGELKRVGCYDGEPNGQWGAASKKAMASFTERVNASLPYEQPDFILLTLVQGHKGRACGQDCPAGQSAADNGRCMPNSILAQADRTKQADTGKREALAAAATAAVTSVAAAKSSGSVKAQERTSIASAWTTTTRETPIETGSIAAAPAPAPVRAPRPQPAAATPSVSIPLPVAVAAAATPEPVARATSILPGRMAMGAPLPALVESTPAAVAPPLSTRIAAAETGQPSPPSAEPVTAATPAVDAAPRAPSEPRIHRPAPRVQAIPRYQPAPQIKRAAEPVVVRRPPPPPHPRYSAPPPQQQVASGGSKSRRMIYDLFQRPDRN